MGEYDEWLVSEMKSYSSLQRNPSISKRYNTWNDDLTIADADPAITCLRRWIKFDERTAVDGFGDFFESSSVTVPEKLAPLRRAVDSESAYS